MHGHDHLVVRARGRSPNNPDKDWVRSTEGRMAHLGGESSKLLFKVLAEWNHALSHTSIAADTPPANANAPRASVKTSKPQPKEALSDNVIGVDLSVRRQPRPTDRAPKTRQLGDDGMEVGHG